MMHYTSSSDDEPEIGSLDASNDQYYRPVPQPVQIDQEKEPVIPCRPANIPQYGSSRIRHSLPAYDLWKPFYPTYLSEAKFRNFHRPKLRHYNNGPQAANSQCHPEFPVKSLSRHIFRTHKAYVSRVIKAIDDNLHRDEIIEKFMIVRDAREISAKSGELYLFEYSEEFPPVLSQVGMASNIITYTFDSTTKLPPKIKSQSTKSKDAKNVEQPKTNTNGSKLNKDQTPTHAGPRLGYKETIRNERVSKQIYFHSMRPKSSIQVIENNLYRAPIYAHELSPNDFIVIRTRNSFYLRSADGIFTVGQTMPLAIIPSPTEAQIQKFRCDLSNVYVHKLFKASVTRPPSIDVNRLAKLFPDYHKSVLVKRLRSSGTEIGFRNNEQLYFKGTSNYGAVSLIELRSIVKPESYCVNMAMLAARQRLRELNYSETMIHPTKGQISQLEPEVLAAPWNTSKAVMSALKRQTYLDFKSHLVDPTGSREGFSCVAWSKSPIEEQQLKDLRNRSGPNPSVASASAPASGPLPLKNPLREKIIHEKLNRLATYQKEAQHIFELQASSLALQDALTSDEDADDEMDEDSENISDSAFNLQVENLSRMVIDNRSASELNFEKEEEVRRQMLADFRVDELKNRNANQTQASPKKTPDELTASTLKDKIMMITRTYQYGERKIERTEIVREPRIIALYAKERGGSMKLDIGKNADDNSHHDEQGDQPNASVISTTSEGAFANNRARPRANSLGPRELCRADDLKLRISKTVLKDCRAIRRCRK